MMITKLVSSLTKVLPTIPPKPLNSPSVSGLWGERLSFQLAYTTDSKERDYSKNIFSVTVLSPLSDHVTLYRVVPVPVPTPFCGEHDADYLVTEPGLVPDLLTVVKPHRLKAISGQWRALWITLKLPDGLAGGDYPLELRCMDADGHCLAIHRLAVRVIPCLLPVQTLIRTEWLHPDCLADYYRVPVFGAEHWRIIEAFVRMAADNGINMLYTPLFTPPLDTKVGGERTTVQLIDVFAGQNGYAFGFERLERWLSMGLRCGIRYFEMSHLFTQWGARFTPKIMVWREGAQQKEFGWQVAADDVRYRDFLAAFLPALTGFLREKKLAGRVFFHISDEPEQEHLRAYLQAKALVAPYLEGFRLLDALSQPELIRLGVVETPVCASDALLPFLKTGTVPPWTYYCCAQSLKVSNRFMAMPGARTRILGVQLYLYRMEGFLHWGYNFYYSQFSNGLMNPYAETDAGEAFPAGDPFLVYPGPDGQPEPSLRLYYMREAMDDFRALTLLEGLRGREFTEKMIYEGVNGVITFADYPRDEDYIYSLRARVNAEIERYKRREEKVRLESTEPNIF